MRDLMPSVRTQSEDVLSVPAGRTHKLIVEHGIHAHPDTVGYRYRPARYMAFRQRGGVMDTLYGFELMCTLDPADDDEAIAGVVRGEFGRRLRAYVDARRRAAGFGGTERLHSE